jgi:hypothetical protein
MHVEGEKHFSLDLKRLESGVSETFFEKGT